MKLIRSIKNPSPPKSGSKEFVIFALLLQITAFWSVWRWLFARISTSSEEVWGIFPLLGVIFFSYLGDEKKSTDLKPATYLLATGFLFLFVIGFDAFPPLVRGVLAVFSVTFFLSAWRFGKTFHLGVFILFLLGLPLMASLNFVLGFPLRVMVGEAVEFLLQMQGLEVFREGVCLHFGKKLIWIDAPCSGIKMLWFGTFLASAATLFFRLDNLRTLVALGFSFVLIFVGNVFRASALFYTEAEIIKVSGWFHEAVGVLAFAVTAFAIVLMVKGVADFKWRKYFLS